MKWSGAFRQQVTVWGFVLALWALLILALTSQLVFTGNIPWSDALRLSLRDWYPWALLSPVVVWLATAFPLERKKLLVSVPVHLLGCLMAVAVCYLLTRPLQPAPNPPLGRALRFRGGGEGGPPFGPGPRRLNRPLPGRVPPLAQRRHDFFVNALVNFARSNLPIYWVIVSITHALTYYRRSQDRERKALELEARLADAKLEALRMQLHPHFLFNTLNAISTLVHKDPAAADEMITNLSELLRATLDASGQEIALRQELDFLNRYLEIQQVRFGDRLRIEKEIDAGALDGLVPTLILQPIVENAVRHGIEPQLEPGLVSIQARREGATLRLIVRDSGTGPKRQTRDQPGIGLANTKHRLHELYGERARLLFNTGAQGGFAVELEIPFHEQPPPVTTASEATVA